MKFQKMRKYILLLIIVLISICSRAQVASLQELEEQIAKEEILSDSISCIESDSVYTPEAWDTSWDNLLNSWYVKHYTNKVNQSGYNENIPVSDSIYVDRLSKLPKVIELPYNNVVRSCIDLYVNRRRNLVEYMLGMESFYFPMIEESLDKYGLPLELKYLTIVESALNPIALSRAGASGLWQFMLPTGKFYGLEINSLVDERRDPVKATDAACRYLKDLFAIYGDWNLSIAAYNCGAGNVNKAIKRAGGKMDYWAIYPYLPKETRSYVPFFIAATYAMNYYPYHQLHPVQTTLPLSTDTIMVSKLIHFEQIAEILQIDKEEIQALNPQYKKDIIPGNSKPQVLKLPSVKAYAYIEMENTIAKHRESELFTNRDYVNQSAGPEKIIHKVAKGENLAIIGSRYGVTTANIRKWNRLKSNAVPRGRNLILYVDNGGYTASNNKTANVPQTAPSTATTSVPKTTATKSKAPHIATIPYKIKSGDSFASIARIIARRYPGYTHEDLMQLNNVSNPNLKVGQYIKIPKN
jgi:membrane-bound lytic murein transglycosylase D